MFHAPNRYRVTQGRLGSKDADGNNGLFIVPRRHYAKPEQKRRSKLRVIVSDGGIDGQIWEHVSVSIQNRCPTWEEMCWIKSLFWDEEDTVIQYHPAKSEYVNCHPFCLHLWRPVGIILPLPPTIMIRTKITRRKIMKIVYILDRSGSMANIWDDALNGLNSFIKEQQKDKTQCDFELILFDTEYEVVFSKPLNMVHPVDSKQAFPRGGTALLDSIGKTINNNRDQKDLIMIIMTDGMENSSREYRDSSVINKMIADQKEKGWEFRFFGAGIPEHIGTDLGIKTAVGPRTKRFVDTVAVAATCDTSGYRNSKK